MGRSTEPETQPAPLCAPARPLPKTPSKKIAVLNFVRQSPMRFFLLLHEGGPIWMGAPTML